MTRRIRLGARADIDLLEARPWYDEEQAGLGARFFAAVEAAIDGLVEMPFSRPRVSIDI